MQKLLALLCVVTAWVIVPASAPAQVLVIDHPDYIIRLPRPWPVPPQPVPQPPMTYKIKELSVQGKLTDQVAQVELSQSFVNTGSVQMEVSFVFPLPYDSAIDRLTLMVDGKEYPGKLMNAEEARKAYEAIVRKNKDPALLEFVGTGMFKTSVFPVPPGQERKVSLRYTQTLRRDQGLTDFIFPLSTAKYTSEPVEKVTVRLNINSSAPLKNVYSPSHEVKIERPSDKQAIVNYTAEKATPSSDFRVLYDVGKDVVGASALSFRGNDKEPGFFMLLATPQIKGPDAPPSGKSVVIAVDRSGSMQGKKIEQAREALKFVVNNLKPGDKFNIVSYSSEVESFKPELVEFSDSTRKEALGYAEGLFAGGTTNIDGALTASLAHVAKGEAPAYVLFLTDGLPTVGERNEMKIAENAKGNNKNRARIITFGVGYDVNSRLLDKLARANFGQSQYVRPDQNLEEHVSRLYSKISDPVLTDVQIEFTMDSPPEAGKPIDRVYPSDTVDLFAGEQLVLVGRYKKGGRATVKISGTMGAAKQNFEFPIDLVEKSPDETNGFVERLWAMRRIGQIIDELDLKGKNEELVKELVDLSTKHGILTQYTSFLADETASPREVAANVDRAREQLSRLEVTDGIGGVAQRAAKKDLQYAANAAPAAAPGHFKGEAKQAAGAGGAIYRDADSDELRVAENVRQVGNKAFYRRGAERRWVDSSVTEEQEKNAQRVTQFSDEYFKLAAKHGRTLSQYLAFDEPVLVNLGGEAWFIEPEKKN